MFLPKWVIGGLLLAVVEGFSEKPVNLKSPPGFLNKLVTSSTLRWIHGEKGEHPESSVAGTVERFIDENIKVNPFKGDERQSEDGVAERDVYICRASHIGHWIPGQLRVDRRVCLISLHGSIHKYDRYEVLENIEGGARLTWARWDKFNEVPSGTVSSGDSFVARRQIARPDGVKTLGLRDNIGKLDIDINGFGKLNIITEDEKEDEVDDGQVLVEIEPVRYELTNIKFNHVRKVVLKSPRKLGEAALANTQNITGKIDTMIGYDDETSVYWGQGKAMLKGLPTIIRSSSDSSYPEEIEWGITVREFTKRLKTIEAVLEPETAVNVTLKGNHTEIETPYTAKLISVYVDGATRAREIHGTLFEVKLLDIAPEYSPTYFTGNYSLVPTTTTTTTTTTTSTTSKTTVQTTSTQQTTETNTNNIIPKDVSNNKINKKEEEVSNKINVMNDQGHAKNHEKSASTQDGSAGVTLSNDLSLIVVASVLIIFRILQN